MEKKVRKLWFCLVCMIMLAVGAGSARANAFDLFGTLTRTPAKAVTSQPKILFVGNSYTELSNFVPMFKKLANVCGIYPQTVTLSLRGRDLSCYVYPDRTDAYEVLMHNQLIKMLRNYKWDYVVLQAKSTESVTDPNLFKASVKMLIPYIKKTGAQTVLYMPWTMKSGHEVYASLPVSTPEEVLQNTYNMFYDMVKDYKVAVSPAGIAFMRSLYLQPNLEIYMTDKNHANQIGAYLSANVMFATLFDRTPVGVDYYPTFSGMSAQSSKTICGIMQELAADVTVRADVANTARVKLAYSELAMQKGSSKALKYQILAPVAGSRIVRWTSSNVNVATVSNTGTVTARGAGTAVITAKLNNNAVATCTVMVTVDSVKIGVKEKYTLPYPEKITWASKDSAIATVVNNQAVGMKSGTVELIGKDKYGNQIRITAKVVNAPRSVQVERTKTVTVGTRVKLNTQTDMGGFTSGFTYVSNNPSVVDVSPNGVLYPKAVGRARVYVKAYNGVYSYCDVTSLIPAKKIQFYKTGTQMTMQWKTVQRLTVVFTPTNTTMRRTKWTSSNPKVVAVDETGVLRAYGKGSAKITAQTLDGSNLTASVTVTVK